MTTARAGAVQEFVERATITVTDNGTGNVDISCTFEPHVEVSANCELSVVRATVLKMLNGLEKGEPIKKSTGAGLGEGKADGI